MEILKHFHGTNLVVSGAPALIQRYDMFVPLELAVGSWPKFNIMYVLVVLFDFFPGFGVPLCGFGAPLGGASS